jgi:outer membrane protein assembly factor BamB
MLPIFPETGSGKPAFQEIAKAPITVDKSDWPWWRGPNRDGKAPAGQKPPISWSESENILWSAPLPGRGHGSPVVVGNRIFLVTADYETETQSVLCFNRISGKRLWKTDVHEGGFTRGGHDKNNLGASTVASDGRQIYVNFLNDEAVYTTALSHDGDQLWQTKISDFVIHQGFGSSPAIHGSLVFVSADNKGGGAIAALERSSGKVVWRHERPKLPNYTSPIILNTAGLDQLILSGCDLISSFDPPSGEKLWEINGSTTEVVTSAVTDGKLVFVSGGYPKRHVAAARADGSGEIIWEKNTGVYVPSMLVHENHLFLVTDNGIAQCWKPDTGEEVWRGRLRGTFSSSPVLAGGMIYVTNEEGRTFVFEANTREFKLLAENQLGDNVMATPTICNSRIYMRVAEQEQGRRMERLYCISEGS